MHESLVGLIGPLVMGMFIGLAYTRGACLSLDLGLLIRYMAAGFVGLFWVSHKIGWQNGLAGAGIGLGLCLVMGLKLAYLHWILPQQLKRNLAARPGEEVPGLGSVDGLWVMSYRNGQSLHYTRSGKLQRISFPDGSQWELTDPDLVSAASKPASKDPPRLM